jgi:hypothetical protein
MSMVIMKDPYDFLPWNPEKRQIHTVSLPKEHKRQERAEKHTWRYGGAVLSVEHFILLFWVVLVVLMIAQWRLSC